MCARCLGTRKDRNHTKSVNALQAHPPGGCCRIKDFVQIIFAFPEMLASLKSQQMPNPYFPAVTCLPGNCYIRTETNFSDQTNHTGSAVEIINFFHNEKCAILPDRSSHQFHLAFSPSLVCCRLSLRKCPDLDPGLILIT